MQYANKSVGEGESLRAQSAESASQQWPYPPCARTPLGGREEGRPPLGGRSERAAVLNRSVRVARGRSP